MSGRPLFAAPGLAAALLSACGALPAEQQGPAASLPALTTRSEAVTYPVERADLAIEVEGSAEVTPTTELELFFREPGRLAELNVQIGDEVARGEVLARLEAADLEHALRLAELDLQSARTRYNAAAATGTPAVELQQLELSKQELRTEYARARVDAYTIRAPIDGVVKTVRGAVGELVSEYRTIVVVSDPTELALQMWVTEEEFDRIEPGQQAFVEVSRGTLEPATVVATSSLRRGIDPTLLRDEFLARLALVDSTIELEARTRHNSRIIVARREQTLVIPAAALREFRSRKYVRVLDGEVRREVDVKVGVRTETHVELLAGVDAGELVIGK